MDSVRTLRSSLLTHIMELLGVGVVEAETHPNVHVPPEHKVLYLPELLEEIFNKLAEDKDVKTLLVVGQVCQAWKIEAFFALRKIRNLLPAVYAQGYVCSWHHRKYLGNFLKLYPDHFSLPVSLVIEDWSADVVYFLTTFSEVIVSVSIQMGHSWKSFNESALDQFQLPRLKDSILNLDGRFMINYENSELTADSYVAIATIFKLWSDLSESANRIQNCEASIDLEVRDNNKLNLQIPRCLTQLRFSSSVMPQIEELSQHRYWPKLQKVSVRKLDLKEGKLQSQLVLRQSPTLKQLELSGAGICCLKLGIMKSLEEITIEGLTITFAADGKRSLSPALPKLRSIQGMTDATMLCLTNGGPVFENVTSIGYYQGVDGRLEAARMMTTFAEYFPNLKILSLEWFSSRVAAAALVKVYELMENLESLKICVKEITTYCDINRLITGYSQIEIDYLRCPTSWTNLLDGKTNAITNLKRLKTFHLSVKEGRVMAEFVFPAAFSRMSSLMELIFEGVDFFHDSEIREINAWRDSGRQIKI